MYLKYKNIEIFYSTEGKGDAVVLLHGFLEDLSMWKNIIPKLAKTHKVIAIDMLGHGKTGSLNSKHSMQDMSHTVEAVLHHLNIDHSILIGHSMGGYVALAYAEKNQEKVIGLCLMNSTYEADSQDRKTLRSRANKMITDNFESMVRVSFANLFSKESRVQFKTEYNAALNIALQTSVQGYIAANTGMIHRKDQAILFKNAAFQKAIILGKKDTLLDYQAIQEWCHEHHIEVHLCSEGHMSHIENKDELLIAIMHFIEKI